MKEIKKIMITAGPTHERIDPVRFIGNYSSGKMGFALARECADRGMLVTLIAGPVELNIEHPNITRVDVVSALEMYDACNKYFDSQDAAIMCAAVADYRPAEVAEQKIKRKGEDMTIRLVPNPDIAASLGAKLMPRQTLVGFALETTDERNYALGKMEKKNLDMIVLNSLQEKGAGFKVDTNKVTLLHRSGEEQKFELKHKDDVATDIVDALWAIMVQKNK